MSGIKREIIYYFLIVIISTFFALDTFINKGSPATMDGQVHTTAISQFSIAISQGDFPVVWADSFANYGMPLGLMEQPLFSTTGALFNVFLHNPVLAYTILGWLSILFSGVFFYLFLRIYFSPDISFAGVLLLTLSPFRIIDYYIRSDLPEVFSGIFLPIILIAIYKFSKTKKTFWLLLLSLSTLFLTLTHPMALVIYSFLFIPYFFFVFLVKDGVLLFKRVLTKEMYIATTLFFVFLLLGVAMGSFYILPLVGELKYFIVGQYKHIFTNQFLTFSNFFNPSWYFFTKQEIYTRGHVIQVGLLETIIVIVSVLVLLRKIVLFTFGIKSKISFLDFITVVSLVVIFFMTSLSHPFYLYISILDKIEFPWRMLTVFIFIPPIIFCFFLQKINNKAILFLCILFVCVLRIPQVYGKNYTQYPQSIYVKNISNLYSIVFNTVWMDKTENYPVQNNKIGVISGDAKILSENVKNSKHVYVLDVHSVSRLVDYTFYFPGWNVYVDGMKTLIQFQDPNYRGVITYAVPPGKHTISVIFQDTFIRRLGKILSVIFIGIFVLLYVQREKVDKLIH